MGVKNSDELRDAHSNLQAAVMESNQKVGQSTELFKSLETLQQKQAIWGNLDGAQRRIVLSSIRSMKNSGVGLEGEAKEKFNKLQLESAELSTKFSNNVLDSTKAYSMKITNKSDLDGLPPSALAAFAAEAVSKGDKDATAGKFRVMRELQRFRGYYSILVVSCFMRSGALDISDLLLSYSVISLA